MTIHTHPRTVQEPSPPEPILAPEDAAPVRERCDGWTAAKQRGFIEVLADTGSVVAAAAAVDMTEQSAHRLRGRADAGAFAAAWEAALESALSGLMDTAFTRATTGISRGRYFRGAKIGDEFVPSDRLLIWLIEKGRTQLGRAKQRKMVSRDWETALAGLGEAGAPIGGYRVWISPHGYLVTNKPPGNDFNYDLWRKRHPGDPDYTRRLSHAEEEAWFVENGIEDAEETGQESAFPDYEAEGENENHPRSG